MSRVHGGGERGRERNVAGVWISEVPYNTYLASTETRRQTEGYPVTLYDVVFLMSFLFFFFVSLLYM